MKNNPFDLKDKNIIITGASSGIGRQCAVSLSEMGARIVLLARREDKLKETISLMSKGDHLYRTIDLTDFGRLESLVSAIVKETGKIDGLIHCAGMEITLPLNMINARSYDEIFSINLYSALELIKVIIGNKYYSPGASIVLISSITSIIGNTCLSLYSATKGAVVSAVRSLAIELAGKNIRINTVSPGMVKSEMFDNLYDRISPEQIDKIISEYPLGIGSPEDVANACIYLLSDASRWVTGTNLIVDGGFTAR
ncbi:MAG: SDR family oxidoreductase [Bacteroidales bacterium]|jgi:NAD(P)-dependent dehydrogenase (short-subunit alcohol dehydrogenase family)|nr:SDR family oxidoreductase [Bacteroidales bacterium]